MGDRVVDFSFRNRKEAAAELKRQEQTARDLLALEKFEAALGVYEFLAKHPKVNTWRVLVEKSSYNDEGLYEGVYADYTTAEKQEMAEGEYDYEDDIDDVKKGINAALAGYFKKHGNENSLCFPSGGYKNGNAGFAKFVRDFIGGEYPELWRAEVERRVLAETTQDGTAVPAQKPRV